MLCLLPDLRYDCLRLASFSIMALKTSQDNRCCRAFVSGSVAGVTRHWSEPWPRTACMTDKCPRLPRDRSAHAALCCTFLSPRKPPRRRKAEDERQIDSSRRGSLILPLTAPWCANRRRFPKITHSISHTLVVCFASAGWPGPIKSRMAWPPDTLGKRRQLVRGKWSGNPHFRSMVPLWTCAWSS